ncbi:MAG: YcbK family protein [Stellaceae bacterium]
MDRRLLLSMAAGWATWPIVARAVPRPPALRRLRLVNPHTGETFDGPYRDDNGPIPQAMADLCVFLRDFHCGAKTQMDVGVLDFLADLLAATGEAKATILSAYRTPQTNAMLARTMFGVAEHSQHMYGRALDFTLGAKLEEAMAAARAMRRGGVGWYPHSNFIHIDSGPVRNWTLDQSGLGNLLLFDGNGGLLPFGGAHHPLTTAERLSLHRQLARAEFLARQHLR